MKRKSKRKDIYYIILIQGNNFSFTGTTPEYPTDTKKLTHSNSEKNFLFGESCNTTQRKPLGKNRNQDVYDDDDDAPSRFHRRCFYTIFMRR